MVPEAPLEETEDGLLPAGKGWFVLNARDDARWFKSEGLGVGPALQGRGDFRQLAMGLTVLAPGEPIAMYHWETDQEDFLVLVRGGVVGRRRARNGPYGNGISSTALREHST